MPFVTVWLIMTLVYTGSAGEPGDDTVPGSSINDFVTEYAKSNRSKCRGCNDTIDKVGWLLWARKVSG